MRGITLLSADAIGTRRVEDNKPAWVRDAPIIMKMQTKGTEWEVEGKQHRNSK